MNEKDRYTIKQKIVANERTFRSLDVQRTQAIGEGELGEAEAIEKRMDALVSETEQLRASLQEY